MSSLFAPRPRPTHRLERSSRPRLFALVALFLVGFSLTGGFGGVGDGAAAGTPLSATARKPVVREVATPCNTAGQPPARTTAHVVRPGENLSRIARRELGSGRLWGEIYRRNRSIIGTNPNLIRPGQTLVVPHTQRTSARCVHGGQGAGVKPSPRASATATPPGVVAPTGAPPPTVVPSQTSSAVVVPSAASTATTAPTNGASQTPAATVSPSADGQSTVPAPIPVTRGAGDPGGPQGSTGGSRVVTWLAVAAGGSALVGGAIFLLGRRRKKPQLSDADHLMLGIRDQMAQDSAQWPTRADYEALRAVRKQVPPIAGYRDGDTVYVKNATMSKLVSALHIDRAGALRELWERGDLTVQESRRARGEWSVQSRLLRSTAYAVKIPAN